MNKTKRSIHNNQTEDNSFDSKERKFKEAEEYINDVMKGKIIKRILFINPPDVDEKIFDYDVKI